MPHRPESASGSIVNKHRYTYIKVELISKAQFLSPDASEGTDC